MHPHATDFHQGAAELLGTAESRIGPVLRIAAVDAALVPAQNLKRRYTVLLGLRRQPRQILKPMHNHVLAVGDDHRLPGHLLAEPGGGPLDGEMPIEPVISYNR